MKRGAAYPRNPESGYALLFIFAMAAVVAISLYTQLPKVVFEAQRDKEQLLIDRGEQYSRAVQLFVHKFNRFPGTIDELENSNNMRFLRRRYVDPMTGKADWRMIHAGPGGVLTDSINSKKVDSSALQNTNSIITLNTGANDTGATTGVNPGLRTRPSDQGGGGQGSGATDPLSAGPANQNFGVQPGNAGNNGPVMVLSDGRIVPASTAANAFNGNGGTSAGPATGLAGAGGGAGQGGPLLPTGVAIQQNGQNNPALPQQLGPSGNAANLINSILTTPRPGGLNGGGQVVNAQGQPVNGGTSPAGTPNAGPQQQVIGAGLAGVASKREEDAIKTYNSKTAYNEWEFVYDVTKDPKFARGAAGGSGAAGGVVRPGNVQPGGVPQMTNPNMNMMSGPGR